MTTACQCTIVVTMNNNDSKSVGLDATVIEFTFDAIPTLKLPYHADGDLIISSISRHVAKTLKVDASTVKTSPERYKPSKLYVYWADSSGLHGCIAIVSNHEVHLTRR